MRNIKDSPKPLTDEEIRSLFEDEEIGNIFATIAYRDYWCDAIEVDKD